VYVERLVELGEIDRHNADDIAKRSRQRPMSCSGDPPPIDWSNLIVSRGGSRDGNQEAQTGRDRYEAAPG
jgi:hypothetical protein